MLDLMELCLQVMGSQWWGPLAAKFKELSDLDDHVC